MLCNDSISQVSKYFSCQTNREKYAEKEVCFSSEYHKSKLQNFSWSDKKANEFVNFRSFCNNIRTETDRWGCRSLQGWAGILYFSGPIFVQEIHLGKAPEFANLANIRDKAWHAVLNSQVSWNSHSFRKKGILP